MEVGMERWNVASLLLVWQEIWYPGRVALDKIWLHNQGASVGIQRYINPEECPKSPPTISP